MAVGMQTTNLGGRPRERQLSNVGKVIQSRLNSLGLSVDELAAKSGVNRHTIYNIMGGRTSDPKASTIRSIAKALGIPSDVLTTLAD